MGYNQIDFYGEIFANENAMNPNQMQIENGMDNSDPISPPNIKAPKKNEI